MTYAVSKSDKKIVGEIRLDGSKSISNRALIIRSLCEEHFEIKSIANSKDTQILTQLLSSGETILDCGPAGTTFRFMTAFLSLQNGSQILTGTERMKQRPIGILVEALKELGADIEYLEQEGYPPLKINSPKNVGSKNKLTISASTSSQYISALLMIAPVLPNGLELNLDGKIVSRPYIEMTLNLMSYFGIDYDWNENAIKIESQKYQSKDFTIEADWSAASYYYSMAAFSDELDLQLNGLFENSIQGDSVMTEIGESFGIKSTFNNMGVHLSKSEKLAKPFFEKDFIRCPDLAQTIAAICGGLGTHALFTGLETLKIKETDRVAALEAELGKIGVWVSKLPPRFSKKSVKEYYQIEGKATVENAPIFDTYEDHRMAMALMPLAMLGEIKINDPIVVEKSYPAFWKDIQKLGFEVSE
jgi:3-phosphoshikimate 1-carboxyvinyltransferase